MASPGIVLCFDRDFTVDVNPHPDEEAVPLSWVKYWAHHPANEHIHVWATGNQHLCKEADIPGISKARDFWTSHYEKSIKADYSSQSPVTYKPHRRQGLRLVKDIYDCYHPDSDITFIVVDDANLLSMVEEGWTYYRPWDFYGTVSRRKAEVPLPVDNPYCPNPAQSKACKCSVKPRNAFSICEK